MTHYTITTRTLAPRLRNVAIVDSSGRVVASTGVVLFDDCDERLAVLAAALDLARSARISAF